MGKKFRKRLRNVLSLFSCCFHARQKSKHELQILLYKSLEVQMQEQSHIKNTLTYLASLLEKFCKNQPLTKGNFGLVVQVSQDKAIQSASTPSTSQTIQTLSGNEFDTSDFKLNLLQHMRQLKQDVLLLKQLLFNADQLMGGTLLATKREDVDFFQSKTRALNFVKFYKLRKHIEEDKKKSFARAGSGIIRRRCNF